MVINTAEGQSSSERHYHLGITVAHLQDFYVFAGKISQNLFLFFSRNVQPHYFGQK